MAFGDADLGVFTADFGTLCQFSGSSANCILNKPIATKLADEGFGGVSVQKTSIDLAYNAFTPMPEQGEDILVNGVSYTIADEAADIDGAFLRYPLKVAN
jgi:hypothetical protein